MREVFNLGDPVVLHDQELARVGEIVGIRMSGSDPLYDVSCETCTIKALFEDELDSATPPVLQGELNAILNAAVVGTTPMPGREEPGRAERRRAMLRNDHVMFLRRAIGRMEGSKIEADCASTSYSVGDSVALRSDGAFDLCVVSGMRRQDGDVLVQVDCMGDVRLASEDDLLRLTDVPEPAQGIPLGGRARFVVDGREDDESFEGVVCSIRREGERWCFSLAFDDGDVFEDLDAADLRPCAAGSALS